MADGGGSGLEQQLTHGKIGPVPVWAAGAMLAVSFIGYMTLKNRSKPPAVSTQTAAAYDPSLLGSASGQPTDGTFPGGPLQDYLSQNPLSAAYPVGMNQQGLPAPVSNAQWARLVADELLAKGDDPSLVSNAIAKYLSGQTLSDAEQAIVNQALQLFGTPPEGLIPVNPPQQESAPGVNKFSSNDQWLQAALAWFGSQPGYAGTNPTTAQIALRDYLDGKPLGLWEQWTVNTVITGTNQLGHNFGPGIGSPPDVPAVRYA